MKNVMGMIYTGEHDARLRELTTVRTIAALPVAGRYRVIDFLASSMVNAGIRNVGVVMQKNYHSLMDHLGTGKEWNLHGKIDGLHILPPFLTRENVGVYTGVLDALRSNTNYLSRSKQEYVVLCNSSMICNPHMDQFIQFHMDTNADITLMYTREESMMRDDMGTYIQVAEDGRVTDMEVDPTHPTHNNTFMEILILKRDYLRDLVDKGVAHGHHELSRDVLMPMVRDGNGRVMAWEYDGPAWRLDSVQGYFKFNMELMNYDLRQELFQKDRPIYTKVRDDAPCKYGLNSSVKNSLVSQGCFIEGEVENCVISKGVHIAEGAKVSNCIIMQDTEIGEGCELDYVIIDKDVAIQNGKSLRGTDSYPIHIAKKSVID